MPAHLGQGKPIGSTMPDNDQETKDVSTVQYWALASSVNVGMSAEFELQINRAFKTPAKAGIEM